MSENQLKFKVSSALKTIIGKELITDDYIAIFELVKNSFDANAKRVDIEYVEELPDKSKLILQDNGKGMDKIDLMQKWLFVAYSAKKDGTEDYRDKIKSSRIYTGSKGIGRFSCDKLGSHLKIFSKKRAPKSKICCLAVDWNDFELDAKKEFVNIPVKFSTPSNIPYDLKQGTILEISNLRESNWDRQKLLKLKHSLEKLINPNQGNESNRFSIHIKSEKDKIADRKIPQDETWKKVNGRIQNFLFEDIKIKATQIETSISKTGKEIVTKLVDREELIYEIKEVNPFKDHLKDICISLFALNKSAKSYFTKAMGVPSVEFGSVFLYKNGIRIYPFGEEGEDTLGIDRRKQQGFLRYLGTRDLIGRIEINGPNEYFQETSSRDGGLIRNSAYDDLISYFFDFALKRLEKFGEAIKWGKYDDLQDLEKIAPGEAKSKIFEIITSLTKSKGVLDFNYDPKIIDILNNISTKSLSSLLKNFNKIAAKSKNLQLKNDVEKAQKQLDYLAKAKDEAEREVEEITEEVSKVKVAAKKARRAYEEKTTENLFLKSVMSKDLELVVNLHHHVGISAGTIENYIKNISRTIKKGKPLTVEMILGILEKISFQARQILSISKFASKTNFLLEADEITSDLVSFIREYTLNICAGLINTFDGNYMDFKFKQLNPVNFELKFKPIEMGIILDNLISNSKKAKAKKIVIKVLSVNNNIFRLSFKDDGIGIPEKNIKRIFEMGFTTTNGAGLGLYHLSKIFKEMKGEIFANVKCAKGAEFILEFKK